MIKMLINHRRAYSLFKVMRGWSYLTLFYIKNSAAYKMRKSLQGVTENYKVQESQDKKNTYLPLNLLMKNK